MITNFYSLSKKFIGMNKVRLLISIIGVSLAVCLITSMFSIFSNVNVVSLDYDAQRNINQMREFGYALSVMAVGVSALFVISNLRLFIYEYMKELAILRSIGSRAEQNFKLIFIQAGFVVCIGTIIGIFFSFVLSTFSVNEFKKLYDINLAGNGFKWWMAIKCGVLSAILMMIFLIIPVVKSSKILPIQVIVQNEKFNFVSSKAKIKKTLLLFILGFVIVMIGRYSPNKSGSDGILGGFIGASLIIIGIFVSLTGIIKQIFTFMLPVFKLIGGKVSYVAVKNIISQVKQNSLIVFTIAGAIMISIFATSVLYTVKGSDSKFIKEQYFCKLMITSKYETGLLESKKIEGSIKKIQGVKNVVPVSWAMNANITDESSNDRAQQIQIFGSNTKAFMQKGILRKIDGDTTNVIFIPKDYAKQLNISDNDHITLDKNTMSNNGSSTTLRVIVVDKLPPTMGNNIGIVDWNNKELITPDTLIEKIGVDTYKANDIAVIKSLEKLREKYPEIKWMNIYEAFAQSKKMVNQRQFLLITVMPIILCIGIAGIIITLNSNMQAKRREFVILRAISITPKQLFQLIMTQSFLYSIIGSAIGVISGIVMLVAVSIGLGESFSIEWKTVFCLVISIISLSVIFTVPMARRISSKAVIDELNSTTR